MSAKCLTANWQLAVVLVGVVVVVGARKLSKVTLFLDK